MKFSVILKYGSTSIFRQRLTLFFTPSNATWNAENLQHELNELKGLDIHWFKDWLTKREWSESSSWPKIHWFEHWLTLWLCCNQKDSVTQRAQKSRQTWHTHDCKPDLHNSLMSNKKTTVLGCYCCSHSVNPISRNLKKELILCMIHSL